MERHPAPLVWAEGSRVAINQMHFAVIAPGKAAVDGFDKAALANRGRGKGEPGRREGAGDYYGAFVLDPDGNNIQPCVRGPAAR